MLARFRPRFNHATVVAYLALFVALGGGALAATSFIGTDGRIHGCVVSKTGQLTVVKPDRKCNKSQIAIARFSGRAHTLLMVLAFAVLLPYSIAIQVIGTYSNGPLMWNADRKVPEALWDFVDNPLARAFR